MSPEQFEELKKLIKETVHEAVAESVNGKFTTANKKLDYLAEDINRGFENISEDRKDMANVKTSQATVERLMRELLDIISNQTSRLNQTVEYKANEAIEKSADAVAKKVEPVMENILQKIKNGIPLGKKPFWKFWDK